MQNHRPILISQSSNLYDLIVFRWKWAKTVRGLKWPIFESLDEGEVENWKHEKQMHPLLRQITKHQTSFFAHEVFEYFLPAQSRHYDGTPSRRERRKPSLTTLLLNHRGKTLQNNQTTVPLNPLRRSMSIKLVQFAVTLDM